MEHNKILGKPKNKNDAYNMLKSLPERFIGLLPGLHINCLTGRQLTDYESTEVHFRNLKDDEIEDILQLANI